MNKLLPLLLSGCLLAGCSKAAAPTATVPAAPTPAPQTLSVYYESDNPAAETALRAYAAACGVTLTTAVSPATAGLAVLNNAPEGGSYRDLSTDALLAAAAARAENLPEGSTVTALPLGRSLYGYWAREEALTQLLGENALADLQAADWAEWSSFVETLDAWLDDPAETVVTLNGNDHTLGETAPDGLQQVFALPLNSGALAGVAYTPALLAAGSRTAEALTGPLNGLAASFSLELAHYGESTGRAACAAATADGTALFYRGSLSDLTATLEGSVCDELVPVPFKCYLDETDISTEDYALEELLSTPILAETAWLAIPAEGEDSAAKAGAAALLWLYGSGSCENLLTQRLGLISPWGSWDESTDLTARQAAAADSALVAPAIEETARTALEAAGVALMQNPDDPEAFVQAAVAALAVEPAETAVG